MSLLVTSAAALLSPTLGSSSFAHDASYDHENWGVARLKFKNARVEFMQMIPRCEHLQTTKP